MRHLMLILTLLSFTAFAKNRLPTTQRVYQSIDFSDDLNLSNMVKAIDRQLVSFNSQSNLNKQFKLGTLTYKRKRLKDSLILFKALVNETKTCLLTDTEKNCYSALSQKMNDQFRVYRPMPKKNEPGYATGETLFTAYYSPDLHGSKTKTEIFKHAIYKMPKSAELRSLTREQIDFENKLSGKNLEIFYVKESLYDIWLLHVEGGGRIQVKNEDGTIEYFYLSYAGANGQKFKMLYHYMNAHGMLEEGKTSIAHQREYLENNPEDQKDVMSSCPSYIFFKVTTDEPLGVNNIPLTENRSLATDYRRYKEYGILNFIMGNLPHRVESTDEVILKPFSRFMINQDTGGAIRGNARSDLYFGFGKKAEFTANHLKNLGKQYFLIKK